MAILGKIRQRSLILILVIAMALFSFVLADLFRGGGTGIGADGVVATVNGVDVEREDFMQKVENMQQQLGGRGSSVQAMNSVWNQELRRIILDQQYETLGLSVERDQMRDLLKEGLASMEEFKNEAGVFDEDKLNEFIANLKEISPEPAFLGNSPINYESWTNYEQSVASNGLYETYFNMVKAGLVGTIADAQLDHKLENESVDLKYIQVPYSSISDSLVEVSKKEISAYINKNKKEFEVEASRDIHYIEFKEVASLEDENEIRDNLMALMEDRVEYNEVSKLNDTIKGLNSLSDVDEIESFINANSEIKFNNTFSFKNTLPTEIADSVFARNVGEYYGPYKQNNFLVISKVIAEEQLSDSIKSRHILIPFKGALNAQPDVTYTKEDAKRIADSALAVVRSDKSKFAEVVTALSADPGSIANGGEYDYHPAGTMVETFDDFENNKNIGEIGVVETDFGYHIIEVLDRKAKKRAIKVANLAQTIEPSEATINELFNEVSKFEIAVQDGDFQDVAKASNYVVKQANDIKELEENITGLGPQRPIVRWAFEEDSEIGDVKRFSLTDGFVVAMLAGKNKEGLMSVEKASARVLPILRKQKKAVIIKESLTGTTLEEMAASQGIAVQTALAVNMKNPTLSGAGREPKVIGAAFGLKEGEISKPIEGVNGLFVVEVTKITPAPELPSYISVAQRIAQAKVTAAGGSLFNALRDAAEIEDNRAALY